MIRRDSTFNEGEDTGTGVADRLTGSVPTIELCSHCIAKRATRRCVPFGELRPFSGDAVGAYSGGSIGSYCLIDLVKIPQPCRAKRRCTSGGKSGQVEGDLERVALLDIFFTIIENA